MAKLDIVRRLSIVLNRGWGDPVVFAGKKQDDLVKQFTTYLEQHRKLIGGSMKYESTHALNEKGIDLLLQLDDLRGGFQLKVESDVLKDNFADTVKRQMVDSNAHGLDKFYLLICAPYAINGKDYSLRINGLVNDLSVAQTPYHAVYPPYTAAKLFDGTGALSETDFRLEQQRLAYEPTTEELLARALNVIQQSEFAPRRSAQRAGDFIERKGPAAKRVMSLETINEVCVWKNTPEELKPVIDDVNRVLEALEKVPRPQRGFLFTCIGRSRPGVGVGHENVSYASAHEIESAIGMNAQRITKNVTILERYGLATLDLDDPSDPTIIIRSPKAEMNVFAELRSFCEKSGESLERMIVDLDFSKLD